MTAYILISKQSTKRRKYLNYADEFGHNSADPAGLCLYPDADAAARAIKSANGWGIGQNFEVVALSAELENELLALKAKITAKSYPNGEAIETMDERLISAFHN